MGGKFKTMTLVEEAELARLRQRQIKDYNPTLRSLVSIQDQIQNIFDDSELHDESKLKILFHLQEKFGNVYNKFKNSSASMIPSMTIALPPPNTPEQIQQVAPHIPATPLRAQSAQPALTAGLTDSRKRRRSADETLTEPRPTPKDLARQTAYASAEHIPQRIEQSDFATPTAISTPGQSEANAEPASSGVINSSTISAENTVSAPEIPAQYQRKYGLFADFLSHHKDSISSNDKGELVIDGAPIPLSSTSHLYRALYVQNNKMKLAGFSDLLTKLKNLNFDPSIVSHPDVVKFFQSKPKSTSTSKASNKMGGKGLSKSQFSPPPGKRPRILHLFHI